MNQSNLNTSKDQGAIRCLVIQLGDEAQIYQTLMSLRAAKQSFSDLELTLVVSPASLDIVKRASWIDRTIELPESMILEPFSKQEGAKAEDLAIQRAAKWLSPLIHDGWDIVAEWTYNETGANLAALLPARFRLGSLTCPDGLVRCMDDWSIYRQAVLENRIPQNIHVVDLLTTQLLTLLQVEYDREGNQHGAALGTFFELSSVATPLRDESAHWTSVVMDLTQAEEAPSWPIERMAELALLLIQKYPSLRVVLIGKNAGARSKRFFERITEIGGEPTRVLDLVGRKSFEVEARAIESADAILTADPGYIHLASILGTRVLDMALSSNRFFDSGPYGNHHWVVRGRAGIPSVKSLELLLESALGFRTLDGADVPDLDLYRTRVRPMDEGGGVAYLPLVPRALTVLDWQRLVVGQLARSWYCGWTSPVGKEIRRETLSPELVQALRALKESTEALDQILVRAQNQTREITKLTLSLRSEKLMGVEVRARLQLLGAELAEMDSLTERLSGVHSELRIFTELRKVMFHNIEGERLAEISAHSTQAYELIQRGVKLYLEWIQYALELARPRSVEKRIDLI